MRRNFSKPVVVLVAVGFCLAVLLAGCSREELPPTQSTSPRQNLEVKSRVSVLLDNPVPMQRVELPGEALADWRLHAPERPTLLLLADNPMLAPVPSVLREQVRTLLAESSREEIARSSFPKSSDPLLMPVMTVDAALRAGWFSQVIWALPLRAPAQELSVEAYRQQLRENRMLDEGELLQLKAEKYLLRGTVRGTPFLAGALDRLPPLDGPVIVHIDQSYFQDRYKNEVATPLLSVVYDTLFQLRERQLPVLAVTFAHGNLEERVSLDVRFLGEMLAHFVEHPERANDPAPPNWQRQADIFHLELLFEKDKMRDLALAMERDDPESAWVKFALYRAAAAKKAGDFALDYLADAVKRDRIYAIEYLNLAQMAFDKRRPDAALQMLERAAAAFPDNPQIKLRLAQLAGEMGDRKTALQLVEQLQQLPWSHVYYPQMPDYLQGFREYLQTAPSASIPAPSPTGWPAGILQGGSRSSARPGGKPAGHP